MAIAAQTLREGMLSDYRDAYLDTKSDPDPRVGMVMDLNAFTDGKSNTRGFFDAPPHPQYSEQGEPIHEESMGDKSFTIINHKYALWIPFSEEDLMNDRTQSLRQAAAGGGANHKLLPERGLFDLLTGTASTIPNVPNAADGTAVFSSSTRFETANGNDLTVSNWNASGAAARGGLFTGLEQFALYKDGKGQPLHRDQVLTSPVVVMHAVQDMDVMAEVFNMGTVAYAASTATSNAGVSNVLTTAQPGGGRSSSFIPWPTSRLSAGTVILALTGRAVKPFLMQPQTGIQEMYADDTNDPEARKTGQYGVGWKQWLGFGVGVVDSILRIEAS